MKCDNPAPHRSDRFFGLARASCRDAIFSINLALFPAACTPTIRRFSGLSFLLILLQFDPTQWIGIRDSYLTIPLDCGC